MAILLLLCAVWGLTQVAIKIGNTGFSPLFHAGVRSAISALLLWAWSAARGVPLFARDGSLGHGLLLAAFFAGEFVLIYQGLEYTTAARGVLFVYTAPFVVALGAHALVPGERLRPRTVAGLGCAFAGIAVAFAERAPAAELARARGRRDAARRRRVLGRRHRGGQGAPGPADQPEQDALLSARGLGGGAAGALGDRRRARRDGADGDGGGRPPLPGGRRGLRQLPRLVLAADALPGRRAVGVLVPHAAVRDGRRRARAGRAGRPPARRGHGARRRRHLPRELPGLVLLGAPTWPPAPHTFVASRRSRGAPLECLAYGAPTWPPAPPTLGRPRRSGGAPRHLDRLHVGSEVGGHVEALPPHHPARGF